MRRLAFLCLATFVFLTGCVSGIGPGDTSPTPNPTVSTNATPPTVSTVIDRRYPDASDRTPVHTWTIGNESTLPSGLSSHLYEVLNGQESPRTMTVTVWRNDSVVFSRAVTLPSGSFIEIHVYRVGEYTMQVDPVDASPVTLDAPETFDCNTHALNVGLRENGEWAVQRASTLLKCLTATSSPSE